MHRALIFVRSILFVVLFYGLSIPVMLMTACALPFGPGPVTVMAKIWAWLHFLCARVLLGQRVRILGTRPAMPCLYIMKHEAMFETVDVIRLFRRPAVVAKQELFSIPIWGAAAHVYGLIPIERQAGARALRTLRVAAREAQAAGRDICLFPEGTRVPHGDAPPIKAGFAGLYGVLADMPVVPVAIDSGRLSPRGTFLKKAGTITYQFGAPVPPGLPRAEAEALVHAAINALNRVDLATPAQ